MNGERHKRRYITLTSYLAVVEASAQLCHWPWSDDLCFVRRKDE